MDYWLWDNAHGGWCTHDGELTHDLRRAVRVGSDYAEDVVSKANAVLDDNDWPLLVAVPVSNGYLPIRGQRILEQVDKHLETARDWAPRVRPQRRES